jgi:hypothetical protein
MAPYSNLFEPCSMPELPKEKALAATNDTKAFETSQKIESTENGYT